MTTGADGATSEMLNALANDVRTMLQQELAQLRTSLGETALTLPGSVGYGMALQQYLR